jgi:cysteine synthase
VKINDNLLSSIGHTPLVRLKRVAADIEAELLVKVEYLNPSGSIKDRIALRMIEDAERAGILRPGMEIVEASTGNTATALAFVGGLKGYRVHLFVPSIAASEERLRILKAYGAKVTPVDISKDPAPRDTNTTGGLHGSIVEKLPRQKCLELERSDKNVWWARQFSNPSNSAAHADGTAQRWQTRRICRRDRHVRNTDRLRTKVSAAQSGGADHRRRAAHRSGHQGRQADNPHHRGHFRRLARRNGGQEGGAADHSRRSG